MREGSDSSIVSGVASRDLRRRDRSSFAFVFMRCQRFVITTSPPGRLSRRALSDLTTLELKIQVSLEYLVLIHRIDADVAKTTRAECVVNSPRVGPVEVKAHSVRQHISDAHSHALQVELAVEHIRIDEVWVERVLILVLQPGVDLTIVFLLLLLNT